MHGRLLAAGAGARGGAPGRALIALCAVGGMCAIAAVAGAVAPARIALAPAVLAVLVVPGVAVLTATGLAGRLGMLGTVGVAPLAGLAAWAPPLAVALAVGLPLDAVTWTVLVGAGALLAWRARWPGRVDRGEVAWAAAAAILAAAFVARALAPHAGDAFFHAGRIHKLQALPELSVGGLSAFADGAPHAGYGFPLLHAPEAAAMRLAGVEPSGYEALGPTFAAFAVLAAAGAGALAGGRAAAAAAALAISGVGLSVAGGLPAFSLAHHPPTMTFWVLFPATVALLVAHHRAPAARAAAAGVVVATAVVALVHPNYALGIVAMVIAAAIVARAGARTAALATAVTVAIFLVIWRVALAGAEARTVTADTSGFVRIGDVAIVRSPAQLAERPDILAALLALGWLLARRQRRHAFPAALVTGALSLSVVPGFPALELAVLGPGQTRRLFTAVPWWIVVAVAAAVLAARLRRGRGLATALAAAAAGSIAVAAVRHDVQPALVALTVAAGLLALAVLLNHAVRGAPLRPGPDVAAPTGVAAALVLAALAGPWVVERAAVTRALREGIQLAPRRTLLTPELVRYMREQVAVGAVVLAPYRTSPGDGAGPAFRLIGKVPVHVVALPEERTRGEPRNRPAARRADVNAFFSSATGDAERRDVLRRWDVDYVLVNRRTRARLAARLAEAPYLRLVYAEGHPARQYGRWVLFRVRSG